MLIKDKSGAYLFPAVSPVKSDYLTYLFIQNRALLITNKVGITTKHFEAAVEECAAGLANIEVLEEETKVLKPIRTNLK